MNTLRSLSRCFFAGLARLGLGLILMMSLPGFSEAQEPSLVGQYIGAVARTAEPPVWTNSHLGARLELTAQASGNFSGKLVYSGTNLSFTGSIDSTDSGSGTSSVRIPRGSQPALTLDLSFSEDVVTGSLSHPDGETVTVSGWRKVWNGSSRPARALVGRHHFHLRTDLSDVGDGFGSFVVPANGDITVTGKLPDGSGFKTTGFVGPNGQVLIYDILHSKPGSLLGVMMISEATDDVPSTLAATDFGMSWYKPAQTAKSERFFREGFTSNCQVSGGLYKAPVAGDIAAGLLDVTENGYLYFSGIAEGSETPAGAFFTLNSAGKVTMSRGEFNRAKATLTLKPATGEYSGGFTLVDMDYNNQTGTDKEGNPIYKKLTRKVKYYGLIVDDGTTAVSSGFYVTGSTPDSSAEPPTTLLTSPLTGGVASIQRNPEAPPAVEIGFEQASYAVTEGEAMTVNLTTPFELAENRTFKVNVTPGSASAADLTATTLSVTLPAGSLTAEIELPVKDDGVDEEDETFVLSVVDGAGFDLSETAVVEVTISDDDYAVQIIGDPQPQLVNLNSNVEMRVEADGSDMKYQWLRQNVNLSGATTNPLLLSNVQLSQAGTYKVKVSNEINEETSADVELAVVDGGNKLMALLPNTTATLNAGVAGTAGTLTYQWQVGGIDVENDTSPAQRITGATTPTLVIKNVSSEDIGDYICVVSQPASFTSLSTGIFFLRLPSSVPSLPDLELPEGQVLRSYYYETLFDTDFDVAPGSFSATGLPNGLRIDPNTGVISGTPTGPVTAARVIVSATNPRGTTTAEGSLTIRAFPASALGTFQGLVSRNFTDDGNGPVSVWPQSDLGARFELTTTVTGSFSGKIIGTSTQNFSGALTFEEEEFVIGSASVPQADKKLPPLSLQFRIYLPEQTLTGSLLPASASNLSEPPPAAAVWGWRNVWTKTQPATDYVGRYNFTLTDTAGASPLESPAGTGFGSFVVPGSGTFNVTGNLPDGTAFICNTFLGPKGEVLLFQPLYKNPGSLHGAVQVQLPYAETDDIPLRPFDKGPAAIARLTMYAESGQELDLTWFKPFQTDAKDKTYRWGFGLRSLGVDGGLYTPPEPGQIVMDLPEVPTNAQIQFAADDTGLDVMPTGFTITSAGKPVIPTGSANPYKLTFTLNAETGHFNGAFTRRDEDPSRPPVYSDTTGNLIRPQGYFTRNARFYGIIAGNPTSATLMGTGYYTIQQLPRLDDEPPVTEANAQNVTASFTLTRNDNAEEPLSFGFTQGDVLTITEGEPEVQVAVSISAPVSSRRTLPISLQHLTSSGADVTLSSASVIFEPDQSEAYVTLSVTQDNLDEDEEYLYLRLADGAGYNLSARRLGVAIVDDDESVQIQSITPTALARTGDGAYLSVQATGTEPLSYQWRLNGVPIPGALSSEYFIHPGALADGGRYDVVVSNRVNTQTSPSTDLVMMDAREFYFPVASGATAALALNITAPAGSVSYEWSRTPGGIPLTDDARITGSSSSTLTVRNVSPDDEGEYYCRVVALNAPEESPTELISPAQRLVIVSEPPLLMEITELAGAVASPFEYQVEFMTDSYRYPASFSATNLPSGLSIHPVTGLISGSPRVAVTDATFTVTATNAAGSSSMTGRITIQSLPEGNVGTFQGLVGRNVGNEDPNLQGEYTPPWPEAELGGLIEVTTLPSGSFSGKLTYAGTAHNFTGFLTNDQSSPLSATALIQRTGKPVLFFDFTIDPDADAITGTVRNMAPGMGAEAYVTAWRKVWSTANPATAYAGTYNFSITTAEGGNERSPGGYGYGTCTVPTNGAAFDIKGRLPDGKPFVCSSQLGPQGQFIVHQVLYARSGSVLSHLVLTAPPDAEADGPSFVEVQGESNLFKPRQTASSETIYTRGIGPVALSYEGGRYVAPAAGEVVMGVADEIDNANISMTGAGADYSETIPNTNFRIRAGGTTVMRTGADNLAKINVTEVKPTSGEFKGSFTLSDTNPSSLTTKISRTSDFFGLFVTLASGETVGRGYFILKQLPDPSALPPITSANAPSYAGMVMIYPGPGPGF